MSEPVREEGSLRRQLRPSGPVHFSITVSGPAEATVIALRGELDVLTAPKLAARIYEVVRARPGDVVIDLRETDFMDSSGLSLLMSARRRLDQRGRRLTVVCGPGPVRRVIELARLTETLGVVASLDGVD